jgi:hypothetical protein
MTRGESVHGRSERSWDRASETTHRGSVFERRRLIPRLESQSENSSGEHRGRRRMGAVIGVHLEVHDRLLSLSSFQ